jgi:hypothetical protein
VTVTDPPSRAGAFGSRPAKLKVTVWRTSVPPGIVYGQGRTSGRL